MPRWTWPTVRGKASTSSGGWPARPDAGLHGGPGPGRPRIAPTLLVLRRKCTPASPRMFSLCLTVHSGSGVSLMVAPRAGQPGRDGNTVGLDVCSDLARSLYVRGKMTAPALVTAQETLPVEERVARLEPAWLSVPGHRHRLTSGLYALFVSKRG